MSLHAYSDADFAGDSEDRKSTGGYIIFLGDGAVSWSSKKQSLVALSSTESEYITLSDTGCEVLWVRRFLEDSLGVIFDRPTTIFEDNQSAIAFASNRRTGGRMKHVEVKFHFIRDLIEGGIINIVYRNTKQMTADVLTKPLPPTTHAFHCERLGLRPARLEGEYWSSRPLQGRNGGVGKAEGGRGDEARGYEAKGIAGERPGMAGGHDGEGQAVGEVGDEGSGNEV
jgi:hypothetical protein